MFKWVKIGRRHARTGINPRARKVKPAKADSESASAGFPFIARGLIPVRGWRDLKLDPSINRLGTLHALAIFAALGLLSWSCATAPAPGPSGVRIIEVAEITPEGVAEPSPEAVPEAVAGDPANGNGGRDELLAGVEEPLSTREALARTIELTTEGLRYYDQGDHPAAHASLSDARIMLLEAELPEVMQERGLAVVHCVLPEDLRHHDLDAVMAELALEMEAAAGASELADRAFIEREVRRILRRFGAASPDGEYLRVFVEEVERYVHFYQVSQREFFERAFARKHKYWPTIEAVFSERGLPVELGYMALVESGFNPRAYSRAGARGIWQFMPRTGRRYQLRHRDDFYDVAMATEAAAEYLLDLIGLFGSRSFLLATAAYNAGEGRVGGCLRQLENPLEKRSFWEIRACLARETREYVPRIMAAAVIGSDPRRFGFDLETEREIRQRYDVVTVPAVTSLRRIAERAGTSVAELRTANSDLASNATQTPVRNFPIYVPAGGGERLAASQPSPRSSPSVPTVTTSPLATSDGMSAARVEYAVRRGDTLSEIAERYGVPYRDVASWNGLHPPYRLRVGQRLDIYPGGKSPEIVYTVKRGNSLRTIADIFAVRYRDIMRWNDLSSSTLRVGQKLVIHPPRPVRVESYRVRRGDTVARIARRFGVPVRDVLTVNGLGSRSLIRPGQRLVVYVP